MLDLECKEQCCCVDRKTQMNLRSLNKCRGFRSLACSAKMQPSVIPLMGHVRALGPVTRGLYVPTTALLGRMD